ncbi:hypothetical protein RB195_013107 [Necator americanus]|uniref:Uncharacterized protein n=1 Tax=Necator americanus TaxID=51031 RepID=A0ABR1DU06_NECAM
MRPPVGAVVNNGGRLEESFKRSPERRKKPLLGVSERRGNRLRISGLERLKDDSKEEVELSSVEPENPQKINRSSI